MIYLAWRIATAGHDAADATSGRPLTFREAALFQWVNPKAWVFAITAVTTYTTVGGRASIEIAIILAVCILVNIGSTLAWTAAIALIVATSAVGAIPYIGEGMTRIIANLVLFLGGAVLVVAVKSLFAVAKD